MEEVTRNDMYADDPGDKADDGKPSLDLVPWESVLGAARVFGFGARKYGRYNWHGLSKSRLFAAALRHLIAWWRGEDLDAETGEPHLYHAACCVLMLASSHGRDDRATSEPFAGEWVDGAVFKTTTYGDVSVSYHAAPETSRLFGSTAHRYRRIDKMADDEHLDATCGHERCGPQEEATR